MSSSTSSLASSITSISNTGTTDRGTQIVTTSGGSMDKTAFLKILAAELSNLDPTQDQDSTAYVTQMAQFAGIEQMNNLNSTMTKSSYESLVGKGVVMTDTDSNGIGYTGIIKGVTTDSNGTTYLTVLVSEDGSNVYKTFKASNIESIIDTNETTSSAITSTALNTDFLTASALKDKDVVLSTTDDDGKAVKVTGTINSVFIDNGVVKIRVTTDDGTIKEYPYSLITQAGDLNLSADNDDESTTE